MIYEPSDDSYLLVNEIRKIAKNKSILDMGSASGIVSITAKKSSAKSILAVDIQDDVIKNLRRLNIHCIKSDLFENIPFQKFNIIAFNPPYLPLDKNEDRESRIATTGGKKGDELILRFLNVAPKFLSKAGKILLIISSHTPRKNIMKLIKDSSLHYRIISQKPLFFEKLELWEIKHNKQ